MKALAVTLCISALVGGGLAQHSHPSNGDDQVIHSHHPTGDADGTLGTISGYVRDVACLLRNQKAGVATSAVTQDCMEKCVREGSSIGILSEEGLLFVPISKNIPDTSVRSELLPYVGKYVKASGKLFERGGLRAIAIEKIEVISRPADSKIPSL